MNLEELRALSEAWAMDLSHEDTMMGAVSHDDGRDQITI